MNRDFNSKLEDDQNKEEQNMEKQKEIDKEIDKEFDGELDNDLDSIIGSDIYTGLNGRKNLTDIIKGSQIDDSSPLINNIINNDLSRIPASLYGERSNSITDLEKFTITDINNTTLNSINEESTE